MASLFNISGWGSSLASAGRQVVSAVANGSWRVISGTASMAASGAVRAFQPVASGIGYVKDAAVAYSVHNYAELFFRLQSVEEKLHRDISSGREASQVNRNELAEKLEEFIDLFQPGDEDRLFLTQLCQDLKDPSVVFDAKKMENLTCLEKLLFPYFEKHRSYIESKYEERDILKAQPGITTATIAPLSEADKIKGIETQIDLLQSNASRMVLGIVMLNTVLGISNFEHIDLGRLGAVCRSLGIAEPQKHTNLVNFLIEVSNKVKIDGKTPDEVFELLIHRIIDFSDHNIFFRLYAKFQCSYFAPLIASFLGNFFKNLKSSLLHFAQLPYEKQLEMITELLIEPLLAHLTALEEGKPAPTLSNPEHPLKKLFEEIFKGKKSEPKTPEEFLERFIEVFFNQFLDPVYQSFTRSKRQKYLEKAAQSSIVVKAAYLALSSALWVAGKVIAPFQWTVNEIIHLIIKTIVLRLCPGLSSATKSSLEIGTPNSWYSLKKNLLLMFQQMRYNSLKPRTADPIYQPAKEIPPEVSKKWNTLLDKLFSLLKGPDRATSASVANIGPLKNIVIPAVSGLALDYCAQEGFWSGCILSSLTSTNNSGFAHTSVMVSDAEKQKVDQDLEKEVGILGQNIIKTVQESTRSDRSYQRAANVFVTTLQDEVRAFGQSLEKFIENPDLFESNVHASVTSFTQKIAAMRKKITETVDASTQALLAPHLDEAVQKAQAIADSLTKVHELEKQRQQVEAKLNALYALDNEDAIFADLRAINPSFLDIDAFEQELKAAKSRATLLTVIAVYKDRANREAQLKIEENKITECLQLAKDFTQWADELQFVKVTSKPTVGDASFAALYSGYVAQPVTRAAMQQFTKNIFKFIGDENHLAEITTRAMTAYLKKFKKKSSKERRAEIEAVKPPEKSSAAKPLSLLDVLSLHSESWAILHLR